MKLLKLTVVSFSVLFGLSCSTAGLEDLTPSWELLGLEEAAVHSIHERNGKLYVGTDRGVFITDTDYSSWKGPALDIEGIQYVTLVLDSHHKIVAAVHYWPDYFNEENPVLFETDNDGETWKEIEISSVKGLTREGRPALKFGSLGFLESMSDDLNILIGYTGAVSRSLDGGRNWEVVYDEGGFSSFLTINRDHPNHIWTGGTVMISSPYLAFSDDAGKTWRNLSETLSVGNPTVMSAAISSQDPNMVLVGTGPTILKTTNGGQTWKTVLEDYSIKTLINDRRSSRRVYASGQHPSSRLSIAVSDNYGDNWTMFSWDEGPAGVWVHNMAVAEIEGKEVVFLGTNRGVYRVDLNK